MLVTSLVSGKEIFSQKSDFFWKESENQLSVSVLVCFKGIWEWGWEGVGEDFRLFDAITATYLL